MRRFAVLALLLAAPLAAQNPGRAPLSRGLADSLYCALAGCTMSGPFLFSSGTAAAPSIAFSADADGTGTGLFRSSANVIGFSTNGVERWVINSSGAFNCATDGGCDIGNGLADPRDLSLKRNLLLRGSTSGTTTVHAPAVAGTADVTLPNASSVLPVFGQQLTFTGPTAARSIAMPDANFTIARTDTGQTFTGNNVNTGTFEADGHVGVGVAPDATAGLMVLVQDDGDQSTMIKVKNANAAGTTAQAILRVENDNSTLYNFQAHGSARTISRWGVTLGGWAEMLATVTTAGDGLAIGTSTARDLILGTNGGTNTTPGLRMDGTTQAVTLVGSLTPSQTAGIVGTTTNNSANAGSWGEVQSCSLATGSSVTLTTATTADVCSISLTAGDCDCGGVADYTFGATTSYSALQQGISTTSATLGAQDTFTSIVVAANVPGSAVDSALSLPLVRVSLAGTTATYLVVRGTFTISTLKAYGTMRCRRVR